MATNSKILSKLEKIENDSLKKKLLLHSSKQVNLFSDNADINHVIHKRNKTNMKFAKNTLLEFSPEK